MKKSSIIKLVCCLIFIVIIFINIGLYISYADEIVFMGKKLNYSESYKNDIDEDGYEELIFFMNDDNIVLSIWDIDKDNLTDYWFAYDENDILVFEATDIDKDGEPNQYYSIDNENEATQIEYNEKSSVKIIFIIISLVIIVLLIFIFLNKKIKTL